MVRWFGPFVKEWLSHSETKLKEWVKSALEHDTLERVSPQLAHSSSILDIYTSFQQLLDVLKDLDWSNELESNRFYYAVFYDMVGALYRYAQLSTEAMVRFLSITREYQLPPASKMAKIGKFRVTIPKMYRKKKGSSPSGQTRLTSPMIMLLLNMFAIPGRFESLVNCIPQVHDPTLVSHDDDILDARRFLFSLTIIGGSLRPTRPLIAEAYIKITNSQGKDIAITNHIRQSQSPVWNENTLALHDAHSTSLTVGIWHRIEGQKDSLYGVGQLETRGIKSGPLTQTVNFGKNGSLNISMEVLGESREILCSIIKWICENTARKMINLLVDQVFSLLMKLSHDFRDRIHELSLKYKSNFIKTNFFKDRIEPLSSQEVEDIEEYLAPLFDYLNSNLEVLMANMNEDLALEVVLGTWNRFIADAEALIVPSLLEDAKERKPWDERRFQFFSKFVSIAYDFFMGDGEGLSKQALHSRNYLQLKGIMTHYFDSKQDLINAYLDMDIASDTDWILKLIKMKGGKDFVEDALKKQVQG
jgi:MUN domain